MKDLGTLGGGSNSWAHGINTSGQVVGYSDTSSGEYHAFLYDESATLKLQDLGTLGGNSAAWDINDSSQVVGYSYTSAGAKHAFLKESGQPMIDLNSLITADSGWTIRDAKAINSDGQIAATGYKDGVGTHALLLTPTSSDPPPPGPSAPTITSPQNNTYNTDGSFSVSGSAEPASTVELFEGTTSKGATKADSSSGAWSIALSGVSEGSHTYSAKAKDAVAGNTSSASNSVTVTVDKTAPTVSSTSPANNTSGLVATANVTATFSEDVDPSTLTTAFTLSKQGSSTSVAANVTYDATKNKATLDPDSTLEASTTYTATIKGGSTGVKDLAGNALAQDHSWTFTSATPQSPSCTITGTANAETISGTSADDIICAGGGSDTIKGFGGNDTLKGEDGNDQLLGGVGNDTLDGGARHRHRLLFGLPHGGDRLAGHQLRNG